MTLLAFVVAIGILVTVHEFGHYIVARISGVKVLRFAVGFGPKLYAWQGKETEWALCLIPLGGYVKMLDEREAPVTEEERCRAFNNQSVYKRIAIVVAGPIANLILAVLLYWVVLLCGETRLHPWVGSIMPQTPAAVAGFQPGDKIISVDGQPVNDWQGIRLGLIESTQPLLKFDVRTAADQPLTRTVDLNNFQDQREQMLNSGNIGISPFRVLPVIGKVLPGSVAETAGLRAGDRIVALDGEKVERWEQWAFLIQNSPGKMLRIDVMRDGKPAVFHARPASIETSDGLVGRLGIEPQEDKSWSKALRFEQRLPFGEAGVESLARVWQTAALSLKFMGRMLIGQASVNNLAGPVTIAGLAGQTARTGLISYLEFLALISISLGVLNLLPIPVLDGGHLMYYVVELCRGRPVSVRAQLAGQRIGIVVLVMVMFLALFNDFSRLLGG